MLQASWPAGLTASSLTSRVDEVVAGEAADGQEQETHDDEAEGDTRVARA